MKIKALENMKESEEIVSSERNKEIFFNTLQNPPKANKGLLSAKQNYDKIASK